MNKLSLETVLVKNLSFCGKGWYKIFALNIKVKNMDAFIYIKMDGAQKRRHLNACRLH